MKKKYSFSIKIIGLALLATLFSFQPGLAQITATQMGMYDFKVMKNLTVAEMNGTTDVTAKLQAAVDAARLSDKTLFIPSGTYLVSNTIDCKLDFGGSNGWSMLNPVNIVGSSINRPTFVLATGASGFSDTNPKCVFKYRSTSTNPEVPSTPDAIMEGGIRSINFDLGTGNTNAVAVNWGCAQYCYIEDIHVEARSGFAGFMGIGGANQLLANISVNGGKYGLYLPNNNEAINLWGLSGEICQSTITGCTFTNQSISALSLWGYGGITMSGITIVQAIGTAIQMKVDSYAPVVQFPFSLIDSKITFTSSSSSNIAISNSSRMNIALYGVYVTGAGTIVYNNGNENLVALVPINSWTHVARFNYIDKAARHDAQGALYTGTHFNALDGTASTAAIVQTDTFTPPSDLVSKHIWSTTPSFEDADAVLVPAGSTSAQIQAAINSNTKVCLAKGTYTLSTPITLKANSIFFGCPGLGRCGTIFTNGYTPTSANWLINTENSASATTYLMDITTETTNIDYMGSVNWQAGANSIIRTIHLDKGFQDYERNIVRLNFTNNGGGRVFNYQDEKANGATTAYYNSGHRKVKISGTSQQLTFYGLNLERGGDLYPVSAWPMMEIVNASKIRIFGGKTEAFQPYATINGCTDIFMTNIIDYCATGYGTTGANQIEITGTNDMIELSNLVWIGPPAASWKLVLDPWNTNEPSRQKFLGAYHYNWSTISDVSAPVNVPATGVSISPTTVSLGIGVTSQLTATVAPANATNKTVSWSTSNAAIATVNNSGLVTGVASGGPVNITATTQDGSYTSACAVTVTTAPTNIALNKTATASSVETGNTVAMGNDGSTTTRWCSADGTLNQWWKVDLGTTSSITGTEVIWEHNNVAYKYKIEVSTDNITWTLAADKTTNTSVGQVMSDNFTASARYVRITVTGLPTNIWTSFYEFRVWGSTANVPVTGVSVSPISLALNIGSTGQLNATVAPANGTNKTVTWSSNKTAVATVNTSGLVTAVAAGSATITVITQDGGFPATCAVTVSNVAVTGVSMSPTTVSIGSGATSQLTATVAPANATNKTVTWSSDNTSVATVNTSGLVTGVAAGGPVNITATTQNGGYIANSAVTVTSTRTNIALSKTASAKTSETGNTAAKGNDGSTTTRWCASSSALNEWWKVDLGATSSITGTEITWELNKVYKYKIEVSTDNSTWTVAVNKTTNTTSAKIMSDNFTATARYVRITVTGLPSGVWASFFEFKVWGSAAKSASTGDKAILDLENEKTNSLKVYPNPVSDILTIELSVVNDNEKGQIFDIAGMLVKEFDITDVKTNMDVDELQNGVYFLRFVKNSAMSAKFIKQQ